MPRTVASWQLIPEETLATEQRQAVARDWASAQRKQLAAEWADQQIGLIPPEWRLPAYDTGQIGATQPVGGRTATSPFVSEFEGPSAIQPLPPDFLPQALQRFEEGGDPYAMGQELYRRGRPSQGAMAETLLGGAEALGQAGAAFPPIAVVGGVLRGAGKAAREGPSAIKRAGSLAKRVGEAVSEGPPKVRRMFHGSPVPFDVPEPQFFDVDAFFGPAYYLTSDPRVSSGGYVKPKSGSTVSRIRAQINEMKEGLRLAEQTRASPAHISQLQRWIQDLQSQYEAAQTKLAPNVRAVNVPESLNLLDADADAPPGLVKKILTWLEEVSPEMADEFDQAIGWKPTGASIWRALKQAGEGGDYPNLVLPRFGYDGIKYRGGKRVPLKDEAGQPIEHDVYAIFESSLPKLRNALSGTPMGAVAGVSTDEEGNVGFSPERAVLGMAGMGAVRGVRGTRTGQRVGQLGARLQSDITAFLSKFPADLRPLVQAEFERAPALYETARRGVVKDSVLRSWAAQMGEDAEKFVKGWRSGKIGPPELALATRQLLVNKTQQVLDLNKAIRGGDNSAARLLEFAGALRERQAVQETVTGVRAEYGRGLRQFRQGVDGALASGDVQQMEKLLAKIGGREWTEDMAGRLAALDTQNPLAVYKFLRDIERPRLSSYLWEIYYNAILSQPITHARNLIGNSIAALTLPIEQTVAAAVGVPLSRLSGRPRARFAGEAPAGIVGMARGLPEGLRAFFTTMKEGVTPAAAAKLELQRSEAFRGPVGAAVNVPSRFLTAADVLFNAVLHRAGMNAEAYRLAAGEGKDLAATVGRMTEILRQPTAELIEAAGDMAAYRTFRQPMKPWSRQIVATRNKVWPTRIFVPFLQTPINLVKFGLERSPFGWLSPDLWKNVAAGRPEAADNVARAFIGSVVAGTTYLYFRQGRITGAMPRNPAERDRWAREGIQPYSVRAGDTWVDWQAFEPFTETLALVAGVVDAVDSGERGATVEEGVLRALFGVMKAIEERSYFNSAANMVDAIEDPETSAARVATQAGLGLVPYSGLARGIAQEIDRTVRAPRGVVQTAQAVLPGMTEQVPPRVTGYGQVRERETTAFSPVRLSQAKETLVDQEARRLGVRFGPAGKEAGGIPLEGAEQTRYQVAAGREVQKALYLLVRSSAYRSATRDEQAGMMESALRGARKKAAAEIVRTIPERERERREREAERKRLVGVGR